MSCMLCLRPIILCFRLEFFSTTQKRKNCTSANIIILLDLSSILAFHQHGIQCVTVDNDLVCIRILSFRNRKTALHQENAVPMLGTTYVCINVMYIHLDFF